MSFSFTLSRLPPQSSSGKGNNVPSRSQPPVKPPVELYSSNSGGKRDPGGNTKENDDYLKKNEIHDNKGNEPTKKALGNNESRNLNSLEDRKGSSG